MMKLYQQHPKTLSISISTGYQTFLPMEEHEALGYPHNHTKISKSNHVAHFRGWSVCLHFSDLKKPSHNSQNPSQ